MVGLTSTPVTFPFWAKQRGDLARVVAGAAADIEDLQPRPDAEHRELKLLDLSLAFDARACVEKGDQ
jgi:hypothetical protein